MRGIHKEVRKPCLLSDNGSSLGKGKDIESKGRRAVGQGGNGSCMCKYVCVGYGRVIEGSRYDIQKGRVRNEYSVSSDKK